MDGQIDRMMDGWIDRKEWKYVSSFFFAAIFTVTVGKGKKHTGGMRKHLKQRNQECAAKKSREWKINVLIIVLISS